MLRNKRIFKIMTLVVVVVLSFSLDAIISIALAEQDSGGNYMDGGSGYSYIEESSPVQQETAGPPEGYSNADGVLVEAFRELLSQSPYFTEDLFQWMMQEYGSFRDYFLHTYAELMQNPNLESINTFLQVMEDYRILLSQGYTPKAQSEQRSNSGGEAFQSAVRDASEFIQNTYGVGGGASVLGKASGSEDGERGEIIFSTGGEDEVVAAAYKEITEDGLFRHYQVELGIEVKPGKTELANDRDADIVLVLDVSASMGGERLENLKEVAKWFVSANFTGESTSTLGLVTVSTQANILSGLTGSDGEDQLLNQIDNLTAGGETNLQAGILKAKEVLGVQDGGNVSGSARDKIIILLSDGQANEHHSDKSGGNYLQQSSGTVLEGAKRWSFLGPGEIPAVKSQSYPAPTRDPYETAVRLAVLEAQYAVSQGIDIYSIDYSGGDQTVYNMLALATYKMTGAPAGFTYSGSDVYDTQIHNPSASVSYDSLGYEGRTFSAANGSQLQRVFESLFLYIQGDLPEITVTDLLDTEVFELVGEPVPDTLEDQIAVSEGTLIWTSKGTIPGLRTIRYTIRVKDEALYAGGTGKYSPGGDSAANPDFQWKVPAGEGTTLNYTLNGRAVSYRYMIPSLSIQPLIDGGAVVKNALGQEAEAVLTGDNIYLAAQVTRGNGQYAYQWFAGEDPLTEEEVLSQEKESGNPVQIDLEDYGLVKCTEAGLQEYTLRLIDKEAEEAGYESKEVLYRDIPVEVQVLDAVLTVEFTGEDGLFEASITRDGITDRDQPDTWRFMGSAVQQFRGTGSGIYTVSAYAPYGYEAVVENGNAAVTLAPVKNKDGEWIAPEARVVVEIRRKSGWYFFDWDWGSGK